MPDSCCHARYGRHNIQSMKADFRHTSNLVFSTIISPLCSLSCFQEYSYSVIQISVIIASVITFSSDHIRRPLRWPAWLFWCFGNRVFKKRNRRCIKIFTSKQCDNVSETTPGRIFRIAVTGIPSLSLPPGHFLPDDRINTSYTFTFHTGGNEIFAITPGFLNMLELFSDAFLKTHK